jgi:hypothetical protein
MEAPALVNHSGGLAGAFPGRSSYPFRHRPQGREGTSTMSDTPGGQFSEDLLSQILEAAAQGEAAADTREWLIGLIDQAEIARTWRAEGKINPGEQWCGLLMMMVTRAPPSWFDQPGDERKRDPLL